MKLNKNGWGITAFIIFIIIFIIGLFFSFVGLRKFGLVDEDYQFIKKPGDIINNKEEKNTFSYEDLEVKMIEASKKYVEDKYNNTLGTDTLSITVKVLVENNYLETLKDNKDRECSGYVEVYLNNNEIVYDPYLKCKKYETKGYLQRKDANE